MQREPEAVDGIGISRRTVVAFAALILVTFTATLGLAPLMEPDEARYAEIAREMLELKDWVTPHLNYVKYFEKPPLVYWLNAATLSAFGMSDFVARLWPALLGLAGVACTWVLGRLMYGPLEGLIAAAVLAATPFYFGLSQVLVLDMPLSTFLAMALTAAWFLYERPEQARTWALLFHLSAAFGVLTKGPVVVVLLGGILVPFAVLRRDFAYVRRLLWPPGIALFLIVALPWFVLVNYRNREFFDFFIVDQHFNRYMRPTEHKQPLLFFVPFILGGMLPWTLLVAARPRQLAADLQRVFLLRARPATLYCVLWAAVIFTFFTFSGSKLATYILPVFCPLAVLTGRAVVRFWREDDTGVFRFAVGLFTGLAAVSVLACLVLPFFSAQVRLLPLVPCLLAAAALLGGASVVMWRLLKEPAPTFGRLLGLTVACMLVLGPTVMAARSVGNQFAPLAFAIRDQAGPSDLVVMYRHYTQGIPLYARRRVIMVREWGELDFGRRQGDQSEFFWKSDDDLASAWHSGRRLFLIINDYELDEIRARLDPAPRELARFGKKRLVVNFPAS